MNVDLFKRDRFMTVTTVDLAEVEKGVNKEWCIQGRVARDPVYRVCNNGNTMFKMTLSDAYGKTFDVVLFGKMAESLSITIQVGMVCVVGLVDVKLADPKWCRTSCPYELLANANRSFICIYEADSRRVTDIPTDRATQSASNASVAANSAGDSQVSAAVAGSPAAATSVTPSPYGAIPVLPILQVSSDHVQAVFSRCSTIPMARQLWLELGTLHVTRAAQGALANPSEARYGPTVVIPEMAFCVLRCDPLNQGSSGSGRAWVNRTMVVGDATGHDINVTLWNETARCAEPMERPENARAAYRATNLKVTAFKGEVKLESDSNGRTEFSMLTTDARTLGIPDPESYVYQWVHASLPDEETTALSNALYALRTGNPVGGGVGAFGSNGEQGASYVATGVSGSFLPAPLSGRAGAASFVGARGLVPPPQHAAPGQLQGGGGAVPSPPSSSSFAAAGSQKPAFPDARGRNGNGGGTTSTIPPLSLPGLGPILPNGRPQLMTIDQACLLMVSGAVPAGSMSYKVRGRIRFFRTDILPWYDCCTEVTCNKKVFPLEWPPGMDDGPKALGSQRWRCSKCNKDLTERTFAYRLGVVIEDESGTMVECVAFNTVAEILFNPLSAPELAGKLYALTRADESRAHYLDQSGADPSERSVLCSKAASRLRALVTRATGLEGVFTIKESREARAFGGDSVPGGQAVPNAPHRGGYVSRPATCRAKDGHILIASSLNQGPDARRSPDSPYARDESKIDRVLVGIEGPDGGRIVLPDLAQFEAQMLADEAAAAASTEVPQEDNDEMVQGDEPGDEEDVGAEDEIMAEGDGEAEGEGGDERDYVDEPVEEGEEFCVPGTPDGEKYLEEDEREVGYEEPPPEYQEEEAQEDEGYVEAEAKVDEGNEEEEECGASSDELSDYERQERARARPAPPSRAVPPPATKPRVLPSPSVRPVLPSTQTPAPKHPHPPPPNPQTHPAPKRARIQKALPEEAVTPRMRADVAVHRKVVGRSAADSPLIAPMVMPERTWPAVAEQWEARPQTGRKRVAPVS